MKLTYKDLTPACKHLPDYDGHKVYGLVDETDKPIVATCVHRCGTGMKSMFGPVIKSGGGWRRPLIPYVNDDAAFTDGLRLSSGMTSKFAGLELPIGGAKSVTFVHNMPELMTDENLFTELMRIFGTEIVTRIGSYLTAEDVGTKPQHMLYLKDHAPRGLVTGFERDVSEVTAHGVVMGVEAALKSTNFFNFGEFGRIDMASYAIEGVGAVGGHIVNKLWEGGARNITICDARPERAQEVADGKADVTIVPCSDIRKTSVDVFMPCALGGTINAKTIDDLNTFIVAGCANNQLKTREDGLLLHKLGIVYAPDFIINAGGLIAVVCDAITGKPIESMLPVISENLKFVFAESKRTGMATSIVADALVRERIAKLALPE